MIEAIGAIPACTSNEAQPQPRLVRAAHEFEAQMMKELLKPMTASDEFAGDDESDSGSGGAMGEFASEALGRALSEQGGLGMARSILDSLSHSGKLSQCERAIANPSAENKKSHHVSLK